MVNFKSYYIQRTDGRRQRYSTSLRRLRKRGYSYSKKSRAWTKNREQKSNEPIRNAPPKPVREPSEFVEWTLHARSNYSAESGHSDLIEEGSFTYVLPEGEKPDKDFMISQIVAEAHRKGLPVLAEFKQVGLEGKPSRYRGFANVEIYAKHSESQEPKRY